LHRAIDAAFAPEASGPLGTTQAIVVVQHGRVLAERYGAGIDATTTMRSWSIAKSVLNGLTGVMVRDGLVALDDPIERPEWSAADDPRRAISVDDALHMSTGLAWLEDYVDADRSSVIRMLYGDEQADMAASPPANRWSTHLVGSSATRAAPATS
jgi:CubicO group peptidase (beta-lactamase class C family)